MKGFAGLGHASLALRSYAARLQRTRRCLCMYPYMRNVCSSSTVPVDGIHVCLNGYSFWLYHKTSWGLALIWYSNLVVYPPSPDGGLSGELTPSAFGWGHCGTCPV
jgi:hypothetical protein